MTDTKEVLKLLNSTNPEEIRLGALTAAEEKLEEVIPELVKHISSKDIGVLDAVENALQKIGGKFIIPEAIFYLKSNDASTRNIAMDLLRTHGSQNTSEILLLLKDEDPDIRIFAADILGSQQKSSVVAALCDSLLNDTEVNVRYQSAISLGEIGFKEAIPYLAKALADEEWVQFAAVEALAKLKASAAMQELIKVLTDSSDLVASNVVDALGKIKDITAIPNLLSLLDSAVNPLNNKIVNAIITILGPEALPLLGAKDCYKLRQYMFLALQDNDYEVQDNVVEAFGYLGGNDASSAILSISEGLSLEQDLERIQIIINSLVKMGYTAALKDALISDSSILQYIALKSLSQINGQDITLLMINTFELCKRNTQRELIKILANRADSDNQDFFISVLDNYSDGKIIKGALLYIGKKANPKLVQEKVGELLEHPYNDVAEAALEACINLKTPYLENKCLELTKNQDPFKRIMGYYSLGSFGSEKFFDDLVVGTKDNDENVRKISVESLAKDKPLSKKRADIINESLEDPSPAVRMIAIEVLEESADYDKEHLLKHLIKLLEDEDTWVRVRCIEKLSNLRLNQCTYALVELLEDPNKLIVLSSIQALGHIGGDAAFRALLLFLNHNDPEIQEAAKNATSIIRKSSGE